MSEPGSTKLLREHVIPKRELDRLWKLIDADDEVRLVHWWELGQPGPDVLYGTVRAPIGKAGDLITQLLALNQLRLRLDVFPYGTPVPDELLVSFERAGRPR